jgi:RNA polymerase sigma factor (sigma-70 family)
VSCFTYPFNYELTVSFLGELDPQEQYQDHCASLPKDWSNEDFLRIRSILRRLTALRIQNADDAEDLVQETLLTVAAKCPTRELQKGILVWSMGVLRKKVGNYYRKARHPAISPEERSRRRLIDPRTALDLSPESDLRHVELRALIHKILAGLPTREQCALRMMLAGMPAHEIAQNMAPESYQNVLNHLYRGRKKLAEQLAKYGYPSRPAMRRRLKLRAEMP